MEFLFKCDAHRRVLYSSLKSKGFTPPEGSEIIVKHLPAHATEYDLLKFCESVGPIFQVRLMMEPRGTNRGYAFVTYINKESACKAVKKLSLMPFYENHYVQVQISMNNCRIFVGGIPLLKTKDEVWRELVRSGAKNIVDVIMFRSYSERAINRGFVFVEFRNHEAAAHFRAKFANIKLFEQEVVVDWSVPIPPVQDAVMSKVTKLFLRNLNVLESHEELSKTIYQFIDRSLVLKVYKFKNYAFVHMANREAAESLLESLQKYYQNSAVEVTWARPNQKMTSPSYRQQIINWRHADKKENIRRSRNVSESSSTAEFSTSGSMSQGCGSPLYSPFDNLSARYELNPSPSLVQTQFEIPVLDTPLVPFQEINEQFSEDKVRKLINEQSDEYFKRILTQMLDENSAFFPFQ